MSAIDIKSKFDRKFLFTISATVEGLPTQRTIVYFPKLVNDIIVAVEPECYRDAVDNPTRVPISDWEIQYMFGVPAVRQVGTPKVSDGGKTTTRQYQMKVNAIAALNIFVSHEIHVGKDGKRKEKYKAILQVADPKTQKMKNHPLAHATAVVAQTGALSATIKIDVFGAKGEACSLPAKEIPADVISEYLMQMGK
jgi:hypothetical protein